jgi:hypothetical protein
LIYPTHREVKADVKTVATCLDMLTYLACLLADVRVLTVRRVC